MNRKLPPARPPLLLGIAALLAVTLLATACSSSKKSSATGGSSTSSAPAPAGSTAPGGSSTTGGTLVHVKNFAFNPSTVTVAVGSPVTWQFDDSISHNVTAKNNAFSSNDLNNGAKFTFTFHTAGTYDYICSIHPSMKASVIVH